MCRVACFAVLLSVAACSSPSDSGQPKSTAIDHGPKPTVSDPGPNPTTADSTTTIVGVLSQRGACPVVTAHDRDYELVVAEPFGFDRSGLTEARSLIARFGARIVVAGVVGPSGRCGPTLRLDHLISVLAP